MTRMIFLAATVAGMLLAQLPAPPAPDALKIYLNLQDSQIQTLQQLRQQQMQGTQALFAELGARQRSLREQLDRGSTDAAALGRALLEIEALRKRIVQTHEAFRSQTLNVLTADQKSKLAALEEARKLAPAVQQAEGLGLLTPPDPSILPFPGIMRFGRGFQAGAAPQGRGSRSPGDMTPMRGPRAVPPLPQ